MTDFAHVNAKPGRCGKCGGTGTYSWGPVVNGTPRYAGQCHSCRGTGKQTRRDMRRNEVYNRHKEVRL